MTENLKKSREAILDEIARCAKILEREGYRSESCPECKHWPVEGWMVMGVSGLVPRCPKCGWVPLVKKDGREVRIEFPEDGIET